MTPVLMDVWDGWDLCKLARVSLPWLGHSDRSSFVGLTAVFLSVGPKRTKIASMYECLSFVTLNDISTDHGLTEGRVLSGWFK